MFTDKQKRRIRKDFERIFGRAAIARTEAHIRASGLDIDKIMKEREELRKRYGLPEYGAVFA